jgi:hypothetical protein
MPPKSTLYLQLVVMDKHLLDNELAAQLMMLQALDHPQGPRNPDSQTITEVKCLPGSELRLRTILLQ